MAIAEGDVVMWQDYTDASGTSVTDESGNGHTIALQNSPTWGTSGVPSGLAGYIALNGTNQYGVVSYDADLDIGSRSWTFSAWVNTNDYTSRDPIFWKGDTSGNWYLFGLNNNVEMMLDDGSDVDFVRAGVGSLSNNTWLHLVGTWDASGEDFYVYVNNTQVGSALNQTMGDITSGASHDLEIGWEGNEVNNGFWDGEFAQTIMFNRVLDSTERADLYASGAGKLWSDYFGGGGVVKPQFTNFSHL
jgi:hypothetical protein